MTENSEFKLIPTDNITNSERECPLCLRTSVLVSKFELIYNQEKSSKYLATCQQCGNILPIYFDSKVNLLQELDKINDKHDDLKKEYIKNCKYKDRLYYEYLCAVYNQEYSIDLYTERDIKKSIDKNVDNDKLFEMIKFSHLDFKTWQTIYYNFINILEYPNTNIAYLKSFNLCGCEFLINQDIFNYCDVHTSDILESIISEYIKDEIYNIFKENIMKYLTSIIIKEDLLLLNNKMLDIENMIKNFHDIEDKMKNDIYELNSLSPLFNKFIMAVKRAISD